MSDSLNRRERKLTEALESSDHKLLIDQLCFNDPGELAEIKTALEHNEWTLPRVCELGFLDILERVYDLHVIDINASYLGKTGLQFASQKGYTDVVVWLLDKGASVNKNVWEKNSEFYLATVNGNQNVLEVLLSREPELVSDSDVCYCLLYAACEGGHLELLKKWFSPGTDVTKKLVFTSNLNVCEQDYPLYAACRGEHLEVAKFLMREGDAILTKEICHSFPKFTTRLVRSIFLNSDRNGCQHFKMSNHPIEILLYSWFAVDEGDYLKADLDISCGNKNGANGEKENTFEIMIDVQETHLLELAPDVLWKLEKLISLNASHNKLETIPDALDPGSLDLNGLKSLNFAYCQLSDVSPHLFSLPCLEELNLSHNKLSTLVIRENAASCSVCTCIKLQSLDLSHNSLTSFPPDIQVFTSMTMLSVSHNQLEASCMPWQCPMKCLDLSYNKLRTFTPNADQYWGMTLKKLLLQNNQITELPESIVKMRTLMNLDVSHNRIQHIPSSSLWCCPLNFLNLNDNKLGICKSLKFPSENLKSTLMELYIASNGLANVPRSISSFNRLYILDLSNNIKIRNLPPELGKLKNLYKLNVNGINVWDVELQKLLSSLNNGKNEVSAFSITDYLERKYRKCVCPNILKVVVLGCKNKDGHCIFQELTNNHNARGSDHEKKVKFQIWELPDTKITSAVLPCFLTLNSLYLIVHDASSCGADLHLVSEKVSSIQACVESPHIIIACLYSRQMTRDAQMKIENKIIDTFPKAQCVSLTSGVKECFSALRQQMFLAYKSMQDVVYNNEVRQLHQRQVPAKFLEVFRKVKRLKKSEGILYMCRMEEFLQKVDCCKMDLEDGIDRHLKLHEFLLQVGAMLHYNNHNGELSDLVILNPAWLFGILSKFLKSLTKRNHSKIAQLPLSTVREKFKEMLPAGDYDYFPAILQLMENFNIGLRLTDSIGGKDEVSLLVPSLLPKQAPQLQLYSQENTVKASRLYCLPAIPSALWSHLISQLILSFGRFSSSKWKLGDCVSRTNFQNDNSKSFMMSFKTCNEGLHIINRKIQYWRSGIMIYYDQGHVVVEEVECTTSTGVSVSGILVTVQTSGTIQHQTEHIDDNKKKLSVMGIVVDEIEEVLNLFNPKYQDQTNDYMYQTYALCPLCYNITPGSGIISLAGIHFTVRDCAQRILSKDVIVCYNGPSSLHYLVPELLFMELPSEMHLSANDIILTNISLGSGLAEVTKATYKGADVAVKHFYNSTIKPSVDNDTDPRYPNVADANQEMKNLHADLETEQRKITLAFSDVRREVGILSKLKHEFIVTFIGVCIKPQLLLVMELAPCGSLRSQLKSRTEGIFSDVEQMDRVITQTVFSKDLTFKIIFQIGCGLCYLHENNIIYRDLKPDNILVMSLSVGDRVNVKLSDYGISKFNTLQGVTGLFGTTGYMAPEVVSKQLYKEKADIYSYAIVMLETLTGLPPSEHLPRSQMSNFGNLNKDTPAHVQGYKIHCHFPYLESLMKECWSEEMDDRPSSESIVKRMKSDQFLLLHDYIKLDRSGQENLEITCVYACQTGGRWKIWISESGNGSHRCISVYDVESSSFMVHRKEYPGPRIIDMAKVGLKIWVICKDMNCLNIIERGNQSNFEIYSGPPLEAKATKILNHRYGSSEESGSIILIGLENGCLTMFHFSTSYKTYVTAITNIELQKNTPIVDICSLNDTLLAVACGMTIYFHQVGLPENLEDEARVSKGTWIPKLTISGSVSLRYITDTYNTVAAMTVDGNAVWCCLENNSLVVKIDTDLRKVVLILTISWNSVLDTVQLQEVSIASGSLVKPVASVSSETSGSSRRENCNQENQFGHNKLFLDNDDVFIKNESNETTTVVIQTKSTVLDVRTISTPPADENIFTEPSAPFDDSGNVEGNYYDEVASSLLSVSEKATLNRDRSKTTADSPPLPEERKGKAFSTSVLDELRPPLPPKRSGCHQVNVNITSLRLATDILVIGTSIGAMVLLPLTYIKNYDTSGCPPTVHFHLPVLRHPGTNSNVINRQGLAATGSISILTLANDKLVSLHSPHNQVQIRRQSTRRGTERKREGGILNPEKVLNSLHPSRQEIMNKNTPVNNTDTSQSTLSSSAEATAHRLQKPDIAVWDTIMWSQLTTIRSFSHSLSNCGGWCCCGPASASNI